MTETEREIYDRILAALKAEAWDEGWRAARVVEYLEGEPVWAHTVTPEGMEPNPYRRSE